MHGKVLAALTLAAVYWFPLRRWMGQWGSTAEERARVMAGDVVILDANHVETQAVTVNAPPSDIWPWLVQIGSQRGGLYSYDSLDRLFGFLERRQFGLYPMDGQQTRLVSRGSERTPDHQDQFEESCRTAVRVWRGGGGSLTGGRRDSGCRS